MSVWRAIAVEVAAAAGANFDTTARRAVGGGCINEAYIVGDADQRFFVKLNHADKWAMFEAEAAGLRAILGSQTVRAPKPIALGAADDQAFIVLEYIELNQRGDARLLGRQLAAMHRCVAAQFGWDRDNTIGATPQPNGRCADWVSFWWDRRLGYQLGLARQKAFTLSAASEERLRQRVARLFDGYRPVPSLLHGDLWSGNYGFDEEGNPVVFDPAVYYGDRETDIAMTRLFGGFPLAFYQAYEASFPLAQGFEERQTLYNLYHVLNHFNLFGGGYAAQAQGMIGALLRD